VFEGLPRFLMNSSFKTWLYKIALNTVLDHRKKVRPQFDDFEVEEIAIRAASPGDRIDTERMKRHVRAVVAELPEKQRLTVELRIYEDLDYREISRILGGSEGSARANFFQGMKTLKEKLSDPR
jgi:RNA polymerase sigma-70 factor (ECF subfamily)